MTAPAQVEPVEPAGTGGQGGAPQIGCATSFILDDMEDGNNGICPHAASAFTGVSFRAKSHTGQMVVRFGLSTTETRGAGYVESRCR